MKTEEHEQKPYIAAQDYQKNRSEMHRFANIAIRALLFGCAFIPLGCSDNIQKSVLYEGSNLPILRDTAYADTKYTSSKAVYALEIDKRTEAQAVPSAEKPQIDPAQTGRLVVYNAVVNVVVERVHRRHSSYKTKRLCLRDMGTAAGIP